MRTSAVAFVLVPVIDQAVKSLVRHLLGTQTIVLGPFVSLRVTHAPVWVTRVAATRAGNWQSGVGSRMRMWVLWLLAAITLLFAGTFVPSAAPFVGLLLGGSLSHALEVSRRGLVEDYICPSFWPAFNFADVAITVGAVGVIAQVVLGARHVWM